MPWFASVVHWSTAHCLLDSLFVFRLTWPHKEWQLPSSHRIQFSTAPSDQEKCCYQLGQVIHPRHVCCMLFVLQQCCQSVSIYCFVSLPWLSLFCWSNSLAERSAVSVKTLLGDELVICLHACGPHCLPMLCCSPAPMQRFCQDPLCDRLMTLPPSYLDLTCIHDSAIFVVTFSISWLAFVTSLASTVCMSCNNRGLILVGIFPPRLASFSVSKSSVIVSVQSLSCVLIRSN